MINLNVIYIKLLLSILYIKKEKYIIHIKKLRNIIITISNNIFAIFIVFKNNIVNI